MNIWADVDGTLFKRGKDYYDVKPNQEIIDLINRLFDAGHYIKIFTSRGSSSGVDFREVTEKQLKDFGVKFHELEMVGKKDLVIDDFSLHPNQAVCPLCLAYFLEKDKILYDHKDYFIIPAKRMKGHKKRIMLVSKSHTPISLSDEIKEEFISFCKDYFDEEPTFALVDSTYASIGDHYHLIACDWTGTEEEIQQLHFTPHRSIRTKVDWIPPRRKNHDRDIY